MFWLLLIGVLVIVGSIVYIRSGFGLLPSSHSSYRKISNIDKHGQTDQVLTDNIQWEDLEISENPPNIAWYNIGDEVSPPSYDVDKDFLKFNISDDINNILRNVIGTKDPLTQDTFLANDRIYFCRRCRLAYHEESWQELDCKCRDCKHSSSAGIYTLPNFN